MYNLYNRLAFNHVFQIGGQPMFKGILDRQLLDNIRLRRDMLLIVKYPKADAFLQMISSKLFQFKSLLRSASVRHFQFGFMQGNYSEKPESRTSMSYTGNLKYLVHICEGHTTFDFDPLIKQAAALDVFPHFIGKKSAMLGLQRGSSRLKTIDFKPSYVLVWSGFDNDNLEQLVQTSFYQEFFGPETDNYAGIYHRKI